MRRIVRGAAADRLACRRAGPTRWPRGSTTTWRRCPPTAPGPRRLHPARRRAEVVGVGGVGACCVCRSAVSPEDVVFLQLKQAVVEIAGALRVHGDSAWHAHIRVSGSSVSAGAADRERSLLGWTTVRGAEHVRQFRNMKGTIPLDAMDAALGVMPGGRPSCWREGHAHQWRVVIAGYMGRSERVDDACACSPGATPIQTEADHAAGRRRRRRPATS